MNGFIPIFKLTPQQEKKIIFVIINLHLRIAKIHFVRINDDKIVQ